MSDRLAAAVAEMVAALRDELAADLAREAGAPERLLSVAEAARALGIGRTALYGEIAAGRCRSLTVGRRRLVPSGAITDYIRAGVVVDAPPAGRESPDRSAPLRGRRAGSGSEAA